MKVAPFSVGSLVVDPPLVLAPMENVTSLPMRLISHEIGKPGLMFAEFISAMAIHYGAKKTLRKFQIHPDERPLGLQIFGSDPEIMAETARHCEAAGADILDINMGCWVPKVCKTGSGAALLRDKKSAIAVVKAVVAAVNIPVSVKVRAGWDYSQFAAPDLAQAFQDCGIQMLTLHARFAKQGFEGQADWDLIAKLRNAVSIPLIGNGDVRTGTDALEMMNRTGCDGVMVGRAAIGNPWALKRISEALQGEPESSEPDLATRISVALLHAKMAIEYERYPGKYLNGPLQLEEDAGKGKESVEQRALSSMRSQLPLYIKNVPGSAQIRSQLSRICSYSELEDLLMNFLSQHLNEVALV